MNRARKSDRLKSPSELMAVHPSHREVLLIVWGLKFDKYKLQGLHTFNAASN
jgi:hypothetical protein